MVDWLFWAYNNLDKFNIITERLAVNELQSGRVGAHAKSCGERYGGNQFPGWKNTMLSFSGASLQTPLNIRYSNKNPFNQCCLLPSFYYMVSVALRKDLIWLGTAKSWMGVTFARSFHRPLFYLWAKKVLIQNISPIWCIANRVKLSPTSGLINYVHIK